MPLENTDAIQTDVSAEITEQMTETERPKSRRELAMEAIGVTREAAFEAESGIKLEKDTTEPATSSAAAPEAGAAAAAGTDDEHLDTDSQLAAQTGDTPKVIDKPDGIMVRVKIDGEEQEVELSKVLGSYQKGSAADKRLEEATRLLKEAKETTQAAATSPAAATTSQAAPPAGDELVEKAKKAFSLLYAGDEDAAAQAFAEMFGPGGGKQPTTAPSIAEITSAVTQQLAADGAFKTIEERYPAILADKDLETLAVSKARAHEAAGKPRHEAMLAAADDVYKLIGKAPVGRDKPPAPRTTRDEKLAHKAVIDNVRPATASAASTSQAEEQEDASSVIAQIAQRRLGQSMPRPG